MAAATYPGFHRQCKRKEISRRRKTKIFELVLVLLETILGCLGVLRSILLKYHGWCVEAGVVKKRVTQGRWRGGTPHTIAL